MWCPEMLQCQLLCGSEPVDAVSLLCSCAKYSGELLCAIGKETVTPHTQQLGEAQQHTSLC